MDITVNLLLENYDTYCVMQKEIIIVQYTAAKENYIQVNNDNLIKF